MIGARLLKIVVAGLRRYRFDLLFLTGLMVLGLCLGSYFVGSTRGSCEEEWVGRLAMDVFVWGFMVPTVLGLQTPLIILTAVLAVGARKSRFGARFCGAVCLALGSLILELPEVVAEGRAEDLDCNIVERLVPWSEGVAYTSLLIGSILIVAGQVSGERWTFPWKWISRAVGLALWLVVVAIVVPWTDSYSSKWQTLFDWESKVYWWIRWNIWLADIPAIILGLWAGTLMLTLFGIRRGWIGLSGIRAAILGLACAHAAVILINIVRTAAGPSPWTYWTRGDPGPFGLGLAVAWTALWFLLGYATLRIRREWWERDEGAAAYSAEMSHRRF